MKSFVHIIKPGSHNGNCYLIKTQIGCILIVTGAKTNALRLEKELMILDCIKNLKLIVITQFCSFTHSNLELFREKYNVKIAMHIIDNVFKNDNNNLRGKILKYARQYFDIREIVPDIIIDEGYSLKKFGLNARIINLSVYSKNTIGILTDNGELFCDDIFMGEKKKDSKNSELVYFKKFKRFLIDIIYPGQGNPIQFESLCS
jgi:hypothetical protein